MRRFFLFLIIIGQSLNLLAQQPSISTSLSNVGTQSPDVASLGKFGEIPVSYETGIPNITIPIYEIKIGKISVPISLDYHAGGIRVNEISSSVGLGWALNCGGEISRSLVGIPDEVGYLATTPTSLNTFDIGQPDTYSADLNFIYQAAAQSIGQSASFFAETTPDMFSYNIPGQTGQFVFNQDKSVFQIPLTNSQIKFYYNNVDGTSYFNIIDEKGLLYVFEIPDVNVVSSMGSGNVQYINAWKLSKIIDPNTKDTVYFNYEELGQGEWESVREDTWSELWLPTSNSSVGGGPGYYTTESSYPQLQASLSTTHHNLEQYLKEIDWRGGKVSFINQKYGRLDAKEARLSEIEIYDNASNLIKHAVLDNNHYFFYNSWAANIYNTPYSSNDPVYVHRDEFDYRMRLETVSFLPSDNSQKQVYSITYDNTQMASRESCAQDIWGFNNGAFNNGSLLAKQTVNTVTGGEFTIGSADRGFNSNYIKACSIQSITYPTGGKTVFELEPHQYIDPQDQNNITQNTKSCSAEIYTNAPGDPTLNINNSSNTVYFTVGLGGHNFRYDYTITLNQDNQRFDNNPRPSIRILDVTNNNQQVLSLFSDNSPNGGSTGVPFNFNYVTGHTYAIICEANPDVPITPGTDFYTQITLKWDQYSNSPVTGGGLRVKSITNYDANGSFINKERYEYVLGRLMTPPNLFSNVKHSYYGVDNYVSSAEQPYTSTKMSSTFFSNSIFPASMMGGSPVLYQTVTKYDVSPNDDLGKNGKTEYNYNIVNDYYSASSTYIPYTTTVARLVSNVWQNGFLSGVTQYKSTGSTANPYTVVNNKIYTYTTDRLDYKKEVNIYAYTNWMGIFPFINNSTWVRQLINIESFQAPTGAVLLHQMTNTDYDENNNALTTTENYYYNNPNYISLTQKTSTNSKGGTITENYKYPYDFAAPGNQYQKMVNENNIEPVIQYQKLNGSTQLVQRNANYSDFNDPNPTTLPFIQPTSIDEKVLTNASDTRIKFNSYDNYGNITQQQKTDDMFQSYIWNYNSVYPVAKVEGASVDDIAYTSFESDEANSNWNYGTAYPAGIIFPNSFMGKNVYLLESGTITSKKILTPSKKYIVSYWSQHNITPCNVSGTIGPVKRGVIINGWTYYEHEITGVTSVSITNTAEGGIDELRLYPEGAQMTTFTYAPLVGMTSQCDAANHITYYEYDGFNRLSIVRDENKNILKTYCYNYSGQLTNCDGNASLLLQSNDTYNSFSISFTNTVTGKVYNFSVSQGLTTTTSVLGQVPLGTYNIQINSTGGEPPYSNSIDINFGSIYYEGLPANILLTSVTITNNTNLSFQY